MWDRMHQRSQDTLSCTCKGARARAGQRDCTWPASSLSVPLWKSNAKSLYFGTWLFLHFNCSSLHRQRIYWPNGCLLLFRRLVLLFTSCVVVFSSCTCCNNDLLLLISSWIDPWTTCWHPSTLYPIVLFVTFAVRSWSFNVRQYLKETVKHVPKDYLQYLDRPLSVRDIDWGNWIKSDLVGSLSLHRSSFVLINHPRTHPWSNKPYTVMEGQ